MSRCSILSLIGFLSSAALAQQAPSPAEAPASAPAALSRAVVPMEEPMPGDHWTYEVRDEITGKTSTQTEIITEVTPTDLGLRITFVGPDKAHNESFGIFDRSWNTLRSGSWRFIPNRGSEGIEAPLAVGKAWPLQFKAVDAGNNITWDWSGSSTVLAEEAVTTKAGTFETFVIETAVSGSSSWDAGSKHERVQRSWFAPAIGHWVKRSLIIRNKDQVLTNQALELIAYGRR